MSDVIETGEYLVEIQTRIGNIITKMENASNAAQKLQTISENSAYEGGATEDFKTFSTYMNENVYKMYEYYKVAYAYQTSVIKEFGEANRETVETVKDIDE